MIQLTSTPIFLIYPTKRGLNYCPVIGKATVKNIVFFSEPWKNRVRNFLTYLLLVYLSIVIKCNFLVNYKTLTKCKILREDITRLVLTLG